MPWPEPCLRNKAAGIKTTRDNGCGDCETCGHEPSPDGPPPEGMPLWRWKRRRRLPAEDQETLT